jgi:uncharacterized protein VirK/YbjX
LRLGRLLAASRALWFPDKLRRLQSIALLKPHVQPLIDSDRFFFFTHDYYLSKSLTLSQRFECALAHYGFESVCRTAGYHRAVYGSARGLELWSRTVHGVHYTIMLRSTEDNRHEGDLSVLCLVNGERVCRIGFSYVHGPLFTQDAKHALFVTRNQTDRNPELQCFRRTFKHNSPPYFCLAAVCGIAMANGMREVYLIRDEEQIAYQPQYAEGFRNSYSELWKAFGGESIAGARAYRMSLPLRLAPLPDVTHRNRAIARRTNWLHVALSARQALLAECAHDAPRPLPGEPEALLPPLRASVREAQAARVEVNSAASCSALSVRSQLNSSSLRPKCP